MTRAVYTGGAAPPTALARAPSGGKACNLTEPGCSAGPACLQLWFHVDEVPFARMFLILAGCSGAAVTSAVAGVSVEYANACTVLGASVG